MGDGSQHHHDPILILTPLLYFSSCFCTSKMADADPKTLTGTSRKGTSYFVGSYNHTPTPQDALCALLIWLHWQM